MRFEWDPDKNEILKAERGISFEVIIFHLEQGDLWEVSEHKDQEKYPGQMIYYVKVNEYIFLVPYIRQENNIFLKTIIPSRKATRQYLEELEK